MARRFFFLILVFVLMLPPLSALSARADEPKFDCWAWGAAVSRFLLNDAGLYATRGPALLSETECVHTHTGLYGNVFGALPSQDFNTGKEVDLRAGYRREVLGLTADVSAAWYYFGIGDGTLQTLNLRGKVGRILSFSDSVKLEAYGVADYQRSLTLGTDSFALAPGVALGWDVPVPGAPNLRLGAEGWYYPVTPEAGRGPVGSFTADLGFPIAGTKLVVGPRVHITLGDVDEAGSSKVRHAFGVFVFTPFAF